MGSEEGDGDVAFDEKELASKSVAKTVVDDSIGTPCGGVSAHGRGRRRIYK